MASSSTQNSKPTYTGQQETLQHKLTKALSLCQYNENNCNFIEPCKYHLDRACTVAMPLEETIPWDMSGFTGKMPPSDKFKDLAHRLAYDKDLPAGGWFLVKEQRDWLKTRLIKIFNSYPKEKKEINILEAGVASYVHHFTYLSILKDALDESGLKHINLKVTVIERCCFPLKCIETINKSCFVNIKNSEVDIYGNEIRMDNFLIELIENKKIFESDQILVELIEEDLRSLRGKVQLKFDIITEHFITAVAENWDDIVAIRKSYSNILEENGFLLCACGTKYSFDKEDQKRTRFLDLHERKGFNQIEEIAVWDPYGMKKNDFLQLLDNKEVEVEFDNEMFIFKKISLQDNSK